MTIDYRTYEPPSYSDAAAAIISAAEVVENFVNAYGFDDFADERRKGELTIIRDGANLLQERADAASALLVAGAQLRQHLTRIENTALDIVEAAQHRRNELAVDFFGEEAPTS